MTLTPEEAEAGPLVNASEATAPKVAGDDPIACAISERASNITQSA